MKNMAFIYRWSAGIVVVGMFLLPQLVFGAVLSYQARFGTIGTGEVAYVDVVFDTQGETINTLEGEIAVSSQWYVDSIVREDSIVDLWILSPSVTRDENKTSIQFAGLMPGGYWGEINPREKGIKQGVVFSLRLVGVQEGEGVISASNVKAYTHNPPGQSVPVETSILSTHIVEGYQDNPPYDRGVSLDTPSLIIVLGDMAKHELLCDGRWMLPVMTRGGYVLEDNIWVKEVTLFSRSATKLDGPYYCVKDQLRMSPIVIHAFDSEGVMTEVRRTPDNGAWWYWVVGVIVVGGVLGSVVWYSRKNIRVKTMSRNM